MWYFVGCFRISGLYGSKRCYHPQQHAGNMHFQPLPLPYGHTGNMDYQPPPLPSGHTGNMHFQPPPLLSGHTGNMHYQPPPLPSGHTMANPEISAPSTTAITAAGPASEHHPAAPFTCPGQHGLTSWVTLANGYPCHFCGGVIAGGVPVLSCRCVDSLFSLRPLVLVVRVWGRMWLGVS